MESKEYRKLINEILRHRKIGWTEMSRVLVRLLVKAALENSEITQEEYDYLIKMLDDDNVPPPPDDKPTDKKTLGNK